ncbi:MAG: hypothetical protein P9L92_04435 [Candidatus Electryonea clarkiae]|nr:hypothetical protein [Candidatus Electryonea clarkiae]MDP8286551.1 hypothetical protein [Candidatus Electryonea clarkiae]
MAKGRSFSAKLAKGKKKRINEAGEEVISVRILKPTEVEGKPGVFRYRAVMMDMSPSMEKDVYES